MLYSVVGWFIQIMNLLSLHDTYSVVFQCPGWESLRLSLGSLSSMPASWVKGGLSCAVKDQQADRISYWDSR